MEIKEIWKDIQGYENLYQISNLGNVKSLKYGKERVLKQGIQKNGYYFVILCKDGKPKTYKIHRLVAQTFLDNPNNYPCVNHKDENKTNNCASNLEFCTQKYNNNYGTKPERIGKANSKPILQFNKQGTKILGKWDSAHQVERELNINQSNITQCCNGKRKSCGGYKWKYLDKVKKAS